MKCKGIKTDGTACGAVAIKSSGYCYFHDPDKKTERKEASSNGGKVSYYDKGLVKAEPIDLLTDKKAVLYVLADTINRVRRVKPDGSIDIKIANSIGFLCSKMIEAQKEIVTSERLDKLEEALIARGDL